MIKLEGYGRTIFSDRLFELKFIEDRVNQIQDSIAPVMIKFYTLLK